MKETKAYGEEEHSLMLVWQSVPEKPGKQRQEKLLTKSAQVAEF
jgi:hypothetical protein